MKLGELRPAFLKAAGRQPRGWDDLWDAFVAVIREPLEEPGILRDEIWVEVIPPHPHDSPHP